MPAPPNYVFTVFAFVAFFLCLIRFPMQLHAWNVGTHLFLAWVGLDCLVLGINSIIWNNNTVNWAPIWCDITARFNIGVSIAIPAVVLSINRRLYLLASPTSVLPSQANKRRELIIDLVIGIGLPIIVMVLAFFAQDVRFAIIEDFGCALSLSATWVSIVIIALPPILLELIAGVYGCLSIHAFYRRRSQLPNNLLNHQNFNSHRYIRLMCFSFCDLLVGIPITTFYLYIDITELSPFPGLTKEHYHFSEIVQVPAVFWRAHVLTDLGWELNRWIMVWGAFIFFAIFGFTKESRNNYRVVFESIVQVLITITGIKSRPSKAAKTEGITFKAATCELSVDTEDSYSVM